MPDPSDHEVPVVCSKCGVPMTVPSWLQSAADAWNRKNRRKDAIKKNDIALCDR